MTASGRSPRLKNFLKARATIVLSRVSKTRPRDSSVSFVQWRANWVFGV